MNNPRERISKPYDMRKAKRLQNLLPNGVPRYIRCYDQGGFTWDRWTIVFTSRRGGYYLAASDDPTHPQGFGQHGDGLIDRVEDQKFLRPPAIGRKNHLGTRVTFESLPEKLRQYVLKEYKELSDL